MELKEFISKYKILIFIVVIIVVALLQQGGFFELYQGSHLKEPRLWLCCGEGYSENRNLICQDRDSCNAKILGYDINVRKADLYTDKDGWNHFTCLFKANIKKNGEVVWESEPNTPEGTKYNADWTICTSGGGTGEVEGLSFAFGQVWWYAYRDCRRVNSYFWIKVPKDKINISVSANNVVEVGESEVAKITITNDWDQDLVGDVRASVCTPTLIGTYCRGYKLGEVNVSKYSTATANLKIPTSNEGTITIVPTVYIKMRPTGIENLNYGNVDRTSVPITQVKFLDLGYITGKEFKVEVIKRWCKTGEKKTLTCPDGTVITIAECVDNKWQLTGEECPTLADTDKDGILDIYDECPNEAGSLSNGCPNIIEKIVHFLLGWAGYKDWLFNF